MSIEGPAEGLQLALAGREGLASLVDHGGDPVGQAVDQLAKAHSVDGILDLGIGGLGPGIGEVVPDGSGKEEGLLGHDAELAAERLLGDRPQVVAVDGHGPARGVIEAGDELGQGGLATTGGPDQGDGLTGGDLEADVGEDRGVGEVPERDVGEADGPVDGLELGGVGGISNGGLGVEEASQLEDG